MKGNSASTRRYWTFVDIGLSSKTTALAFERSRWTAYPLGLAMVGELVEGILRPLAADADRSQQLETLRVLVLSVFDRYPTPAALGEASWSQKRIDLARRLQLIGLHPPK